MGGKSTNITSQQMLPLFQVISDLEKPYESSLSLATNVSNLYLNNKSLLDNDDIIIHHYSKSDNLSSGDVVRKRHIEASYAQNTKSGAPIYGRYLDTGNTKYKYTNRNRRKHKRHSKADQRVMDEITFKFNGRHGSERHKNGYKTKSKSGRSKRNPMLKYTEATTNTDNSSPMYDNGSRKKRIGLFTEMGLSAFKDDNIDLSRHFKNITKEDFINSETEHMTTGLEHSDPIYEVPKSVKKRHKSKSKDELNSDANDSTGRMTKVVKSNNRMSRKRILQKYEEMMTVLMEKNQHNDIEVQEKDMQMGKMKSKLKELLSVNNQFADENEYMKKQHGDMKICIEQYKTLVKTLEERVAKREVELENSKGKCHNCNDREITAMKAEKQCVQLAEDLLMLKNVVYRLNVQLSRYQDKLRSLKSANRQENTNVAGEQDKQNENTVGSNLPVIDEIEDVSMPPLPNFDSNRKAEHFSSESATDRRNQFTKQGTYSIEQQETAMAWGDVNTHTLAPLLNAYQESIVEKDQLIRDYECEFNRFTTKLKYFVDENNAMHEAMTKLANELASCKEKCGLATTERDTLRKESEKLRENVNVLTNKLTEVHTVYEQKVETMSRDYTLIHEEYFKCKSNLSSAEARCQMLQEQCAGLKDQDVVPSNIHQNRIEECRRLFEDLKVRYENDKERLNTRINILQQSNELSEKKMIDVMCEKQKIETKWKHSDHSARKHSKEIEVLKNELLITKSARDAARKRAGLAINQCKQLVVELQKIQYKTQNQKAKNDKIKETFKELEAVEDMLKKKDRTIEAIKEENDKEITRLKDLLREKMATIEAMRRHINHERVKRYGSLQHLNISNTPENNPNTKTSDMKNIDNERFKSSTNLPSSSIMAIKGGYFVHRSKHKSST